MLHNTSSPHLIGRAHVLGAMNSGKLRKERKKELILYDMI